MADIHWKSAYVDSLDVDKAAVRAGLRDYVVNYFATVSEVTSANTADTRFIVVDGTLYEYSSASGAAHDGVHVLVSADGDRYLRAFPSNLVAFFASITALRAATTGVCPFAIVGLTEYTFDAADTSTADNGTTVIVTADGKRFKDTAPRLNVTTRVYTSGTTWNKPTNPRFLGVQTRGVGGGGAGGSADAAASQSGVGGGGGAGGEFAKWLPSASLGATETVTIGAAGAPGAAGNNSGGAGGNTSFGSHATGNGGAGGGSMATGTAITAATAGAGGAASGGDVNRAGGQGQPGIRQSATIYWSGAGASSSFGAGGAAVALTSADGNAATGNGAGGSGGAANSATDRAGGAGSGGLVIVEEYYE